MTELTQLEQLQQNVADTKAAADAAGAAFADADAVRASGYCFAVAYDAWDDKRAALVNARLELNEYLEVQDYD